MESAKNGHSCGQDSLGNCYEDGIGTNKDKRKAFEWYEISARGGNKSAQYNLGRCYQYGIGTEKNNQEAIKWYKKTHVGRLEKLGLITCHYIMDLVA